MVKIQILVATLLCLVVAFAFAPDAAWAHYTGYPHHHFGRHHIPCHYIHGQKYCPRQG